MVAKQHRLASRDLALSNGNLVDKGILFRCGQFDIRGAGIRATAGLTFSARRHYRQLHHRFAMYGQSLGPEQSPVGRWFISFRPESLDVGCDGERRTRPPSESVQRDFSFARFPSNSAAAITVLLDQIVAAIAQMEFQPGTSRSRIGNCSYPVSRTCRWFEGTDSLFAHQCRGIDQRCRVQFYFQISNRALGRGIYFGSGC